MKHKPAQSTKDQLAAAAEKIAMTRVADIARKVTDNMYAALVIALHEELGLPEDDIGRVLAATERIWETASDRPGRDIFSYLQKRCEEETGIVIVNQEDRGVKLRMIDMAGEEER